MTEMGGFPPSVWSYLTPSQSTEFIFFSFFFEPKLISNLCARIGLQAGLVKTLYLGFIMSLVSEASALTELQLPFGYVRRFRRENTSISL